MRRKLILILSLCFVAACSALLITACSDSRKNQTHNFGEWISVKKETCTQKGQKYRVCADDGCNFIEWETVSETDHDFDIRKIGIKKDGHFYRCNFCNAAGELTAHNYSKNICTDCLYECGTSIGLNYELKLVTNSYTVTGIGNCTDDQIVIPDFYNGLPVTSIGDFAFKGCSSVTSITIPESVTDIGDCAFENCDRLKFNEYENLCYLGNADNPCHTLVKTTSNNVKNCVIDSKTKVIANNAFFGCSALTTITIPKTVTYIGSCAFSGCSALESFVIPEKLTKLNRSVFEGCASLRNIDITDSVKFIYECAFKGCVSLEEIFIPDNVIFIGDFAFEDCTSLSIRCQTDKKPKLWNSKWNYSERPVDWGYNGES